MKIEALHEFHDTDFSKGWADRFEPTPERLRLFETILFHIQVKSSETINILELGIGPGFLAKYILTRSSNIHYIGLDFSQPMLEIAMKRTQNHRQQINFVQADLINEDWTQKISKQPNAIVSTWALHDLFEKENIFNVYKSAYKLLPKSGIFLNGDFIKPEASQHEYEGGRIKPSEHIALLQAAGFHHVECLAEFEKSVEQPTTANNYACFKAIK